jgi:hypothetical protein
MGFGGIGGTVGNILGGITGSVERAFSGTGYQSAGPDPNAFKDPNAEANKKKIADFLAAYQTKQGPYTAPQIGAVTDAQTGLVNRLNSQVQGTAPSVAEQQLLRGREDNIATQLALAGSARGVDPGSAMRVAARNIAAGNAEMNSQAGVLRAQEQNQAAQTLAGVTQGIQTLNQNAQNQHEQLVQNYLNMGLSIDQANFMAGQKLQEIQAGVNARNAEMQQRGDAALIGAIGGGAAAYLGS